MTNKKAHIRLAQLILKQIGFFFVVVISIAFPLRKITQKNLGPRSERKTLMNSRGILATAD